MGDLISRKALMEELFKTPKWDNRDEDVFFDLIDNQPTAYDIDKVVEQLEEASFSVFDEEYNEDIWVVDYYKAIEIVKKGGAV